MDNLIALDIETTGLDPKKDKITCVGVYSPAGSHVFRDVTSFKKWIQIQSVHVPGTKFVGQNFGFDLKFLYWQWGIDLRNKWGADTQLAAYTLTDKIPDEWLADYERKRLEVNKRDKVTHRKAGKHSLKTLAPYFLGADAFWETPDNHDNDEYVIKDCKYTYDLFQVLTRKLDDKGQFDFYQKRLLPWAKMCLDMEINGMPVDLKVINKTRASLLSEADSLQVTLDNEWAGHHEAYRRIQLNSLEVKYSKMEEKAINRLKDKSKTDSTRKRYRKMFDNAAEKIEKKINLDSSKQKLWLFRDRLGLDCKDFNGDETTGAPVIRKYADEGREDLKLYLKIQESKKLANFCDQWLDQQIDGRIYANFNLARTRTGRLSSSDPNLQQVSSKLYQCFQAKPGYKILSYDMAAIEAALIGYYSDDPVLYEILKSGLSIHCYNTANLLFEEEGFDPKEVKSKYPSFRRVSKEVGFALFYNAGWRRLQASYQKYGHYKSEQECRAIHEKFKRIYSVAYDYAQTIVKAMERGEVVTNILGRPLSVEDPSDAYMKAFNKLIQSSASDLVVEAARKASSQWDDRCKLVALVHDQILAEVREDYAEEASSILINSMTSYKLQTKHGPIQLQAEGAIADCWSK